MNTSVEMPCHAVPRLHLNHMTIQMYIIHTYANGSRNRPSLHLKRVQTSR